MFEPPAGSFFVGYLDDVPVASGAWRRRGDVEAFGSTEAAEIKRMYVAPPARGEGWPAPCSPTSRAPRPRRVREVMVLETGTAQPEAIALYTSSGYTPIEPFGHYKWSPDNRCFAKLLP